MIHLATYVAAALAFGHQTAIGADFVLDKKRLHDAGKLGLR